MKKIIQKASSDKDFTKESYKYMKEEFDKERAKPFNQRDWNKLERLSSEMNELFCDSTGQEIDSGKAKLLKKISEIESTGRKSPTRSIKRLVPAIAIAAVLMAANCISVLAWDMNIVSAVIEFTKGGFSVDFDKDEPVPVELSTSEDDPYGFIAKLAEYDIEFETPHYIPEGFVLTEVETGNNDVGQIVRFFFENGKMVICLTYSKYYNEIPQVVIPSDYYNISETEVNGTPAIVSKEDNQYTIMYQKNKTEFFMFSNKVPYDECEKIVDSIH